MKIYCHLAAALIEGCEATMTPKAAIALDQAEMLMRAGTCDIR